MWARNTLTQRVIGPKSIVTVELYMKGMKDGDVAGLGNINVPCSWIGIVKGGKVKGSKGEEVYTLRCFEQATNDTTDISLTSHLSPLTSKLFLRMVGDYDNDRAHYEYSLDGTQYQQLGREMPLSYQLKGGYAEFDNFTVEEPLADRSQNIPLGKTVRIVNLATGKPAIATTHGLLYDTDASDRSPQTRFRVIDKGQGQVILQCEDGRYVFCSGYGIAGDVRLTADEKKAEVFMWQDYLDREFMLMSMRTHRYVGKSPTTGSPYSMDFTGADPARRNGAVFRWEE